MRLAIALATLGLVLLPTVLTARGASTRRSRLVEVLIVATVLLDVVVYIGTVKLFQEARKNSLEREVRLLESEIKEIEEAGIPLHARADFRRRVAALCKTGARPRATTGPYGVVRFSDTADQRVRIADEPNRYVLDLTYLIVDEGREQPAESIVCEIERDPATDRLRLVELR